MEISNCGSLISNVPAVMQEDQAPIKTEQDCYGAKSLPRRRRRVVKSSPRHVKRKATVRARREKSKRREKSAGRRGTRKVKIRCMRAGPLTINAFLNFMREFRRKNCGLRPRDSISKGAHEWRSMGPDCKAKFIKAASRVSRRRSRSRPKKVKC